MLCWAQAAAGICSLDSLRLSGLIWRRHWTPARPAAVAGLQGCTWAGQTSQQSTAQLLHPLYAAAHALRSPAAWHLRICSVHAYVATAPALPARDATSTGCVLVQLRQHPAGREIKPTLPASSTHLARKGSKVDRLLVNVQRRQLVEVGCLRGGAAEGHEIAHLVRAAQLPVSCERQRTRT